MGQNETFIYEGETYLLILNEREWVFHPETFGLSPIWKKTADFYYSGEYKLDHYKLYLKGFQIHSDSSYPIIQGVAPLSIENENKLNCVAYHDLMHPLYYSGALVIAKNIVDDFDYDEDYPCFCYKEVIELIFEDGVLVTTIDHSKAMVRIRKNIHKGLRNLNKAKDARCIHKFIKSSFVGKYRASFLKRSWKVTKDNIVRVIKKEKEIQV